MYKIPLDFSFTAKQQADPQYFRNHYIYEIDPGFLDQDLIIIYPRPLESIAMCWKCSINYTWLGHLQMHRDLALLLILKICTQ